MLRLGKYVGQGSRVLVAMSGGVDSALSAVLLTRAGFKCIGINMRTYHPQAHELASGRKFQTCCSPEDAGDARRAADKAEMPFYLLDLEKDFEAAVVAPFVTSYLSGQTPNPCVLCNNYLKLGILLEKAKAWNCDFVATGHYAFIEFNDQTMRYELRRPADKDKDQTYYLSGLTQDQLAKLVCPLGGLRKSEVREFARELGISVHDKPDSQEICFVPGNDYREFLKKRVEAGEIRPGQIVTTSGKVLGSHEGVAYYTIGQRKGLGIAHASPLYVVDLLPERNLVVVGTADETMSGELECDRLNWVAMPEPGAPFRAGAQIRYRHTPAASTVHPLGKGRYRVVFDEPQRSITPGQAIVFYSGETVLAGGWIVRNASTAVSAAR